jgi:plasmid stabilization system protein ParE
LASYIAQDSLATAERFLDAFEKTLDLLTKSPLIGNLYPFRHPRLGGIRRFFVKGFPNHLIFYRVHPKRQTIEIIRVLYASRDIQKLFERKIT